MLVGSESARKLAKHQLALVGQATTNHLEWAHHLCLLQVSPVIG